MTSKNFSIQRVRSVPAAPNTTASVLPSKASTQSIERDPFEFNEFSPPKQLSSKSDYRKQQTREQVNDTSKTNPGVPFRKLVKDESSSSKNTIIVGLGTKSKSASALPERSELTSNPINHRNAPVVVETRPKVIVVQKIERSQPSAAGSGSGSGSLAVKAQNVRTDAAQDASQAGSTNVNVKCSPFTLARSNTYGGQTASNSAQSTDATRSDAKLDLLFFAKPKAHAESKGAQVNDDWQPQPRIGLATSRSELANRSEPPAKKRALPFRIDSKLFDDNVDELGSSGTLFTHNSKAEVAEDDGAGQALLFTDDFDSPTVLDTSNYESPTSAAYDIGSSSGYAKPKETNNTNANANSNPGSTKPKGSFDFPDEDMPVKSGRAIGAIVPQMKSEQAKNGAVIVKRYDKGLYTVVHNVQDAHLCEESGEAQSFVDDVEYLLDGLEVSQSSSTRALTMTKLAERACQSEFRRNLRAHCFLPRIVATLVPTAEHGPLADLPNWMRDDTSLSLACSCFLFVLSCDRLNVELNVPLLRLFAALVRGGDVAIADAVHAKPAEQRTSKRVRELLEQTSASFFDSFLPDELNASNLALEGLLNWIARKDHLDDDWLKRELRLAGVMDRVAALVVADCAYFGETLTCQFSRYMASSSLDADSASGKAHTLEQAVRQRLRRSGRCLRLFQLVTYTNRINQDHLAAYRDGELLCGVARLIQLCTLYVAEFGEQLAPRDAASDANPGGLDDNAEGDDSLADGDVLLVTDTLLSAIQAVLNLTHSNSRCATQMGRQAALVQSVVACACLVPALVARDEKAFELRLLALGLLVNLIEQSSENESVLLAPDSLPFRNAKLTRIVRRSIQKRRTNASNSTAACTSLRKLELFDESKARDNLELLVVLLGEADALMRTHESEVEQVTDELIRDAEQHASTSSSSQAHSQLSSSSQRQADVSAPGTSNAGGEPSGSQGNCTSETDYGTATDSQSQSQSQVSNCRSPAKQRGGVTTRLINNKQFIDQAVKKAGRHMEYSMIVAYIALSLGRLLPSNVDVATRIRRRLPNHSFDSIIDTLFQFQQFMELTFPNSAGSNSVSQVIDLYRQHNL